MRPTIMLIFCICNMNIFNLGLFAQSESKYDLKEVVRPSPEPSALGKYGEIPVSLNVGMPQINIPLYEIKGPQIKVPIFLSYYNQGFKVSEVSTSVGFGWTLNSGGVITRVVNGWPDESGNGYFESMKTYNNNVKGKQCNSSFPHTVEASPCSWRKKAAIGEYDLEPDEFYFNFNGYTGHFVFNDQKELAFFSEQDLKIEYSDPNFDTWTIKTPDGTRYIFDDREVSTFRYSGIYYSAWYLSTIITPDNDVVYFEYEGGGSSWADQSISYPTTYFINQKSYLNPPSSPGMAVTCEYPTNGLKSETPTTAVKYLSKIRYPKSGIEVKLDYKNDRKDIIDSYSLQRLEKITITSQMSSLKETIKEYLFDNDLYFGNQSSPLNSTRRLKLRSVKEVLSQAKHTFKYEEAGTLPSYNSPDYDHWGFYNAANNYSPIPEMPSRYKSDYTGPSWTGKRESSIVSKACMLSEIVYPTGGYTQFTWEPNRVTYENIMVESNHSIGGYCSSGYFSMSSQESDYATFLRKRHVDDLNMPVNVNITPFIIKEALSNILFTVSTTGSNQTGYYGAYLYKVSQSTEGVYKNGILVVPIPMADIFEDSNFKQISDRVSMNVQPGTYLLFTITSLEAINMSISVTGNYMANDRINFLSKTVGGFRIAQTTTSDAINPQKDIIKTYDYSKDFLRTTSGDIEKYSGTLFYDPYHSNYSYAYKDHCNTLILTSHLVDNLGFTAQKTGGHIGYSEVTEIINNKEGGFTTTTFQNGNEQYSRNLILSEKVYNKDEKPIRFVENQYTRFNYMNVVRNKLRVWLTEYIRTVITASTVNGIYIESYDIKFGETMDNFLYTTNWYSISTKNEKTFFGNDSTTLVTQYSYEGVNNSSHKHILPTRITTRMSDGSEYIKRIRYTMDFEKPNNTISALQNMHVNIPVEEQEYRSSKLVSSFYLKHNAKASINQIYRCNLSKLANNQGVTDSGDLAQSTFYEEYINFDRENVTDNILSQRKLDALFKSYIWGYNKTLPVIEIENLTAAEIPESVKSDIAAYTFSNSKSYTDIQKDIKFLQDKLATIKTSKPYSTFIYTYRPLIGITSITAPSGITTYYDYDSFGRLKETYLIENGIKKVLQSYDYHYKNQ